MPSLFVPLASKVVDVLAPRRGVSLRSARKKCSSGMQIRRGTRLRLSPSFRAREFRSSSRTLSSRIDDRRSPFPGGNISRANESGERLTPKGFDFASLLSTRQRGAAAEIATGRTRGWRRRAAGIEGRGRRDSGEGVRDARERDGGQPLVVCPSVRLYITCKRLGY